MFYSDQLYHLLGYLEQSFIEHFLLTVDAKLLSLDAASDALSRVHTDLGKSIQIFQAWKVMELGVGPGKSWKINQIVAVFLTRVHVFGLYIHYHCPMSTVGLGSICCLV